MSDTQNNRNPLDAVRDLLAKAALTCASPHIERLGNGKNNQTYRLDCDGKSFLLKHYFRHPQDKRDRQAAELAFLHFCQKHNMASVPVPLAQDRPGGWSLFQWLDGRPAVAEDITQSNVDLVCCFLRALADAKNHSEDFCLEPAAEACFSIQDHMTVARNRLERLLQWLAGQQNCPAAQKAERLARHILMPVLKTEEKRLGRRYGQKSLARRLPWNELVPSPSDIGFHNIVVMSQGLGFVDFEYAGLDDAAKMLCDFFCQPAFPVPIEFLRKMPAAVFCKTHVRDRIHRRVEDVLMLHRIKWCCIMLNVFNPANAERRYFASAGSDTGDLREMQIKKSVAYMQKYIRVDEHGIY